MRAHPLGEEAAIIGRVTAEHPGQVALRTLLGTRRCWTCWRESSCHVSVENSSHLSRLGLTVLDDSDRMHLRVWQRRG